MQRMQVAWRSASSPASSPTSLLLSSSLSPHLSSTYHAIAASFHLHTATAHTAYRQASRCTWKRNVRQFRGWIINPISRRSHNGNMKIIKRSRCAIIPARRWLNYVLWLISTWLTVFRSMYCMGRKIQTNNLLNVYLIACVSTNVFLIWHTITSLFLTNRMKYKGWSLDLKFSNRLKLDTTENWEKNNHY